MVLLTSCLLPCLSATSPDQVLDQALYNQDIDLIWTLVKQDPDALNLNSKVQGRAPLHLATLYQDHELIRVLISHHVDVNAGDHQGRSSLFIACLSGRLDIVQLLFNAEADIHQADHEGTTPFMASCWRGHVNISQFLYKHGASFTHYNYQNESALSLSRTWSQLSSLQFLIDIMLKDVLETLSVSPSIPDPINLKSKILTYSESIQEHEDQITSLFRFGAEILLPLREILRNESESHTMSNIQYIVSKLDQL